MSSVRIDRQTLEALSESLDRVAGELTDAERSQLRALVAVGSWEVARLARREQAGGEQVDILGGGFGEALHPLTGAGAAREVEAFDAWGSCEVHFSEEVPTLNVTSGGSFSASGGGLSGGGSASGGTMTTTTSGGSSSSGSHR